MTNAEFLTSIKTVEFWLTFICTVAVILITSGLIPVGTLIMKITLALVTLLQAYGFMSKSSIRTENVALKANMR